jgi:4'-phosphopantetheinyl transferase
MITAGVNRAGWMDPPDVLQLSPNEVHLWLANLRALHCATGTLAEWLAPEEVVRADRFVFPHDRLDFIVRRGLLRSILSRYLKSEPTRFSFAYGPHGKPELVDASGSTSYVSFNFSHSAGLALYAFTLRRAVGVDIERIDSFLDFEALSGQFFSRSEHRVLQSLSPDALAQAFFQYWTSKEAIVKAIGDGLSLPLDRFDVCQLAEDEARLIAVEGKMGDAGVWQLARLSPPSGYAAAVAVKGRKPFLLQYWQCAEDGQRALLGRVHICDGPHKDSVHGDEKQACAVLTS